MTSRFAALRERRHTLWLRHLRDQLHALVQVRTMASEPPEAIWLFGSRARGDWDGWSDTDLIVVAEREATAQWWADVILEAGLAQDVLAMTRERWQALPASPSAIWQAVARDAVLLLGASG
ncbi:nucleotidyltransferase domain-containing protein [Synechococcus sp. RSCCF101]|uniref:nucleotidyltransferase domain-containing protein n=1 Tax=Synechococcus sp. RSCCF101 TaxID=2511069 RepID=UPI001CD97F42|nr:nucleotidyltransferase domain-containing protein [Synechococcus sp. RSCCF101]